MSDAGKPTVAESVAALGQKEPPSVQVRWHIERNVSIIGIVTILTQTFLGIWWIASLTFEVHDNSRRLELLESIQRTSTEKAQPYLERFYKLETQQIEMTRILDELLRRVDRNEEFRRSEQNKNGSLQK